MTEATFLPKLMNNSSYIQFENWRTIDYQESLTKQLERIEFISQNPDTSFIIFCKHPEIVTLGRSTKPGDVFAWDGETIEVSRGGRATYHGPSQLVIYPLLSLKTKRTAIPTQDVVAFLRVLENSIIEFLALYHLSAVGKSLQHDLLEEKEQTGVWINNQKIASLGIAVKKWVTYHGAAINIYKDIHAYRGMNPCGFNRSIMTSLEEQTNLPLSEEKILNELKTIFLKNFKNQTD